MMRNVICGSIALLSLCCCHTPQQEAIPVKTGDLVFQVCRPSGFVQAINAAACSDSASLTYAHVGIIEVDSVGEIRVIEAEPKNGVTATLWRDFLADADSIDGKPMCVVMRLKVPFSADDVVANAKSFMGQPYDHAFLPDNGMMYCSELVYESYYAPESGEHIFTATPMNFRDSEGNMPEFWIEKYGAMGIPIPEGEPGTHPNDLAKSPSLTEVYRTF